MMVDFFSGDSSDQAKSSSEFTSVDNSKIGEYILTITGSEPNTMETNEMYVDIRLFFCPEAPFFSVTTIKFKGKR